MAKSKSSYQWLKEHHSDPFVQQARKEGFRSRAVYKLQEIDGKDRLLKPGQLVIELGAAPGGWSQWISQKIGEKGEVIALDILPVEPYAQVRFIQGDFREDAVFDELLSGIDARAVDLIVSDMSPDHTGVKSVDMPRAMYLVELSMDLAKQVLKPGGTLLMKVFQGEGFDSVLQQLRQDYQQVVIRKPEASRGRSREQYVLGKGKKS